MIVARVVLVVAPFGLTATSPATPATPTTTSAGVDVAPGDAAQLRTAPNQTDRGRAGVVGDRPTAAWPELPAAASGSGEEISTLLAGASRVLMAGRLVDAPDHARVQALLVQAVALAAQISRTIAAQQQATAAQRRAAAATARAATAAAAPSGGWRFTKSGADVLDGARAARAARAEAATDVARPGLDSDGPQQSR